MKGKRMSHFCMNKECNWNETSHKIRDGIRCPECDGLVMSITVKVEEMDKIIKNTQTSVEELIESGKEVQRLIQLRLSLLNEMLIKD